MATVETDVRASVGFASKTGPRKANEDFAGAVSGAELPEPRQEVIAAIADGIGGAKGGRVAAETAVRGFLDGFCDLPETMEVQRAGARIVSALRTNPSIVSPTIGTGITGRWRMAALMSADPAVGNATTSRTKAVQLSVLPDWSAAPTKAPAVSSGAERSRKISAMLCSVKNPCTPSLHSRKRSCNATGCVA